MIFLFFLTLTLLFHSIFSYDTSSSSSSSSSSSLFTSSKVKRQLGSSRSASSLSTVVIIPPEDLLAGKWLDQWPIGNGKVGSLVGGSINGDILPVSLEGFFVRGKLPNDKPQEPKYLQFQRSREALVLGNIQESHKKLSSLVSRNPLGMFQYLCDVVLLFSSSKIRINQIPRPQSPRETINFSRKKIWNDINEILMATNFGKSFPQSKSSLDMVSGVVRTTFQSLNSLHHIRTWYASAVDDVIVGRLKCRSKGVIQQPENCLNFGMRLSRHMNKNGELMAESGWNIRPWSMVQTSSSQQKSSFVKFGAENIAIDNVYGLELSIFSSEEYYHSGVVLCGVIVCLPSENKKSSPEILYSNDPLSRKYLVCNEVAEAHILLSAHSDNYTEATKNKKSPNAQRNCWQSIENALQLGPETLRKRHVQSFSERMTASEIHFGEKELVISSNMSLQEPSDIASQLQLLTQSNSKTPTLTAESLNNLYSSVLTSSYWYSKYLLLSSTSRSVNNLQGLWADGPFNPWNGDYHLNINVQMTYWPVHQFGIQSVVFPPLIEFIKKISKSGQQTAKELYNCEGWVAHGFTDNLLDVGVRGGLEWAMCVTCGAWLALHLWDHLTYTHYSIDFVLDTFFPIYESMITFYNNYLFEGPDGLVHSGPTTSPENSYTGVDDFAPEKKITNFIALSPAIDLSILRQVANSYSAVISWSYYELELDKSLSNEKKSSIHANLDHHLKISNDFTKLIQRMKNSAVPVIHPVTNQILEYPIYNLPLSPSQTKGIHLSETLDRGHRHFSSLHWLYPGTFIPFSLKGRVNYHEGDEYEMIQATKTTLGAKIAAGGGHTGWSAAWETCLWARLRKGTNSFTAVKKLVSKYLSRNLFGLHPKLQPSHPNCATCYGPIPVNQIARGDTTSRGMSTSDSSVYQMEANSGLAAGLLEMLFQSHIPSVLLFLPALPVDLSSGEVKRIVSRGGFPVSFQWKNRLIRAVLMQFSSWHPWFIPQSQEKEGYYTIQTDKSVIQSYRPSASLTLILPNAVRLLSPLQNGCASLTSISLDVSPPHISLASDIQLKLEIISFPCEVLLCSLDEDEKTCRMRWLN